MVALAAIGLGLFFGEIRAEKIDSFRGKKKR
jgi:hypothetical protein